MQQSPISAAKGPDEFHLRQSKDGDQSPRTHPPHQGIIWIYLNGRCNFHCDYCLDDRNTLSGRAAEHNNFIERLFELQSKTGYSLVCTGGEPLIELKTLIQIFEAFPTTPKSIQTNGSLISSLQTILPKFGCRDWLSISLHDESYANRTRSTSIPLGAALARSIGVNVLFQLMCTPQNIAAMIDRAETLRAAGYKTALRRIFSHATTDFLQHRNAIETASTEKWAAPAFFADPWLAKQPFKALTIYLNGEIRAICKDEHSLGNLYSSYDLQKLEGIRGENCDEICHCCSCIWVNHPWGFA